MQINNDGEIVENWTAPPHPGPGALVGEFVRLEPLNADKHAADLFRANGKDAGDVIWKYLPYGPFSSVSAYHHWVRDVTAVKDPYFYAIQDKATGHFGGIASLMRISPEVGSIEVGHINLAPELQRSKAATEAMYLLMQWVFEAGYRRYEWKCDASNMRSRRAAERFGFSYEGIFRQHVISKGRNRDTAWFACIDKEWPALKEAYGAWLRPENFDSAGRQIEALADLTALVRVSDDPDLKAAAAG